MRHITNSLNRELERRMAAATIRRRADPEPPPPPPPQPPPDVVSDAGAVSDEPGVPTSELREAPIKKLHETILEAYRTVKNLSSELNGRKALTDNQLKDFNLLQGWLFVTNTIANQYFQALAQMEKSLEELHKLNEMQSITPTLANTQSS